MGDIALKRHCFALDLVDSSESITSYKKYHENVWPEIEKSIFDSGIKSVEIYCIANRLFMILEVDDSFSFEKKAKMDADNLIVQEWETLMWEYQQAIPNAKPGEKWVLMEKIYQL